MRKRRLILAVGASLATVALTMGTALADPPTSPPPAGTIIGAGAQTTEGALDDLCNNVIPGSPCASYDVTGSSTITTKPAPANCAIARPSQGGGGFDSLIANPGCQDFARVVTSSDASTRPAGFTYIPMATDALTYAVRANSTVPLNLDIATLKRIYTCDPAITFPSVANGFKPLIGIFGAGNRTLFFQKLGITDSANYTTQNPCVKDGFSANDGRVLTDPKQLITYSTAPYLAQVNRVEGDIHGNAILGSINGTPSAVLNNSSFIARTVYNVVRNSDISGSTPNAAIENLFVGPNSQVCSHSTTIQQHGFNTTPLTPSAACGNTSLQTTN